MLLTLEKVAILQKAEIFASTPPHVLASVAAIAEEVAVENGETFIKLGELETCMYVVVNGHVDALAHDGKVLISLGPGQTVGEMALLDPSPRSASVQASEPTRLFRIQKDAFDELLKDRPEIAQSVIQMLCRRLRKLLG
jgi:CRP-like cAMP-binding protein